MNCRIVHRMCFILLLSITFGACRSGGPALQEIDSTSSPVFISPTPSPPPTQDSEEIDVVAEVVLPTPLPITLPTPVADSELAWRPPPYPVPWAIQPEDHFLFTRPIPSGQVNWPHPRFRYGSTFFGESAVHTGVDLGADRGAPVIAAGAGEVVWAGYGLYRGTYDITDPYGLAVAIRHDFGHQGELLYTIYAHMQSVLVWDGQRVEVGEQLGTVGSTGHADGPHLHFEVRIGENRYFNTRNPELWMVPPEGWAVLAGQVRDTIGNPLPEQLIKIRSIETDKEWEVWTYVNVTIHPDPIYNENFVISDLPAGPYEITIDFAGRSFVAQMYLYPGQTNFFLFTGRKGYVVHPTPPPIDLSSPPNLK